MTRSPNPMADSVGPFYDEVTLLRVTGWTRNQLEDKRSDCAVLALETSDGLTVYPVFQFIEGRVTPQFADLLGIFRNQNTSWWAVASWFRAPTAELGDLCPYEWIGASRDPKRLTRLAYDTARRWAG